jgi:hypothetical protein
MAHASKHVPDLPPVDRQPRDSIVLESDKWRSISVRAVAPTWRDVWAILRGCYQPKVQRTVAYTAAYYSGVIADVWTSDRIKAQFYDHNPLMSLADPSRLQAARIPIHKADDARD